MKTLSDVPLIGYSSAQHLNCHHDNRPNEDWWEGIVWCCVLRVIASVRLYECLYTDKVYSYYIKITDNKKQVARVQKGQESVCLLIYGFPNVIPGLIQCLWWICQAGQWAVPSDSGAIHFLMLSQTHKPKPQRSVITAEHTSLSFCTSCVNICQPFLHHTVLYTAGPTVCWGLNTHSLG